jgi:GNAT superfamily N-acetyltransferase
MIVRAAVEADAPAIAAFNAAMAAETEDLGLDRQKLEQGVEAVFCDPAKGFYVVAESDSGVIGCLMVTYEWSDWRNAWFWWIQSVYIVPAERGKKVYSRMYDFVKDLAGSKGGVCGFRLYVENSNVNAQKVYKAVGMTASHYQMYEETK